MRRQKRKTTAALLLTVSLLCAGCGEQAFLETMAQAGNGAAGAPADSPSGNSGAGRLQEDMTSAGSVSGGTAEEAGGGAEEPAAVTAMQGINGGAENAGPADSVSGDALADGKFTRQPVKVRGIYITGPMAGHSRMQELIRLVEDTELNAMVIDVKNDEGIVTYDMPLEQLQETGAVVKYVPDMKGLVETLHGKGIYAIARIVAFKDPKLAEAHPEWAVRTVDGEVFRDKKGLAWVNPYRKEVWEYLMGVAEQAADAGFDEIQFDYIRFATDLRAEQVDFGPEASVKSKTEIITEFTAYAYERLHPRNVFVSADVYGTIMDSTLDQSLVGQDYAQMARNLDYVCPMIYPSHYNADSYQIPVPDADPYRLIYRSLRASRATLAGQMYDRSAEGTDRLGRPLRESTVSGNGTASRGQSVSENDVMTDTGSEGEEEEIVIRDPPAGWEQPRAAVRPWLQDFTATWVKGHIPYGAEQLRAQIQAVYDAGYEEWILWNARNTYTGEGLLTAAEAGE